jgi:hypothetical protein
MPGRPEVRLETFPRSGSCFLEYLIRNNLKVQLTKSHSKPKKKRNEVIVTIARDPFETILSEVAMITHYRGHSAIASTIQYAKDAYLKSYEYFIKNSYLVILYEDIVLKPEKVVLMLESHLGAEKNSTKINIDFAQTDMMERKHLTTSKTSSTYANTMELLRLEDLSEQYLAYKELLKYNNVLSIMRGKDD